jgi:hypothetical protein
VVLLAAFVTQVGAPQTAPILIAVVTAFLTMECVKYLRAAASRRTQPRRNQQLRLEGDRGRGPHAIAGPIGAAGARRHSQGRRSQTTGSSPAHNPGTPRSRR